jgi:signal transduction histidine kinase
VIAVGLLAAIAWDASPIGLVLVVPPLVLVWLAHREFIAGLVEREQMQDLATTAEQIARDRDPAARLPAIPHSGRLGELAAGLNRMLAELERASGRERHLMRAAAEELHAPVRRITRHLNDDDVAPAARARILADVEHVARVLDEMESVVRAGRPGSLRPAWVPLDSFLSRVGAEAARELDGRLTVVPADAGAGAHIDARWMERALLQMLENARVHARAASHVELRVARTGGGGGSRWPTTAAACRRPRGGRVRAVLPHVLRRGPAGARPRARARRRRRPRRLGGDRQPARVRRHLLAAGARIGCSSR